MLTKKGLSYKLKYVFWDVEAVKQNLNVEEFYKLTKTLDKSKKIRSPKVPTKIELWLTKGNGSWYYEDNKSHSTHYLYMFNDDKFYKYSSNYRDDNKNNGAVFEAGEYYKRDTTGTLKLLKDRFKELNNITFKKAFNTVDESFKTYIPRQFEYSINSFDLNMKKVKDKNVLYYDNVSAVDFSSMYPSRISKSLPNAKTAITVEDYVKPNEEYPFAFYPDSGHLAIYNELDTHKWLNSSYRDFLFRTEYNTEKSRQTFLQSPDAIDTKTILMKASEYNLYPIYKEAYDKRKTDENAKMIMNASIGQMHRINYTRDKYAHLVAVCIARSSNDMLKILKEVKKENIIQICVDGILYRNSKDFGIPEQYKDLGVCIQEFSNCRCSYKSMNCYLVEKDNKIIKIKKQGYNKIDGQDINETSVTSLNDIERFEKIDSHLEEIKEDLDE